MLHTATHGQEDSGGTNSTFNGTDKDEILTSTNKLYQ